VQAALTRELGHSQCSHRVRDDVGGWVVDEAGRGERLLQALVERVSVACMQFCALDPLRRVLRVEVEREPHHLGAEPALEPLGRGLADAAEGSDVVRPDGNVKIAQGTTYCLVPPDQSGSARAVGCGGLPKLPSRIVERATLRRLATPRADGTPSRDAGRGAPGPVVFCWNCDIAHGRAGGKRGASSASSNPVWAFRARSVERNWLGYAGQVCRWMPAERV